LHQRDVRPYLGLEVIPGASAKLCGASPVVHVPGRDSNVDLPFVRTFAQRNCTTSAEGIRTSSSSSMQERELGWGSTRARPASASARRSKSLSGLDATRDPEPWPIACPRGEGNGERVREHPSLAHDAVISYCEQKHSERQMRLRFYR
jgi:hypothetical protein